MDKKLQERFFKKFKNESPKKLYYAVTNNGDLIYVNTHSGKRFVYIRKSSLIKQIIENLKYDYNNLNYSNIERELGIHIKTFTLPLE